MSSHLSTALSSTSKPPPVLRLISAGEQLRFADLFAGIGGFHLAFESIGARCVFAAENDRHARAAYEANFRHNSPQLFESGNFVSDICAVDADTLPDFDVLCAGFPCQAFSLAGKRGGFSDPRGTLFFEIARLLKAKRPPAYFLENVQGLQSHDGGRTLEVIQRILKVELGYSLHKRVVRASDFGLPQLRPRLFMVGFREPSTDFTWPEPVPLTRTMDDIVDGRCNRRIGRTVLTRPGGGREVDGPHSWDTVAVDGMARRLTTRECLRMQGFPPDHRLSPAKTHARRQVGNAIAVAPAKAVAVQIAHSLGFDANSSEVTR